jgi:hypothetical protein
VTAGPVAVITGGDAGGDPAARAAYLRAPPPAE